MDTDKIANEFEELIQTNQIEFHPANISDLEIPPWMGFMIGELEELKIDWKLGNKIIEGCYCIKINHPTLCYLDLFPSVGQFIWCDKEHQNSIKPSEASIILTALRCGVSEDKIRELKNQILPEW